MAPKTLNYLAFQSFDFERTRWRLFQKRVVRTKFDIYVIIFVNKVYIQVIYVGNELLRYKRKQAVYLCFRLVVINPVRNKMKKHKILLE